MRFLPTFAVRAPVNSALVFRVLRGAYGAVFLLSGLLKLGDIPAFSRALDGFMIVPPEMLPFVALAIPLVEIGLGVGLLVGFKPALASGLGTALLGLFTGVVAEKLIENAEVRCGCFGSLTSATITGWTLLRNTVLILWGVLLTAYYSQRHRSRLRPRSAEENAQRTWAESPAGSSRSWSARDFRLKMQEGVKAAAFVLLLTLVCILVLQNRELKNRLAITADRPVLRVGDVVPSFQGRALDGTLHEIEYSDGPTRETLLFVFSPRCEPCRSNMPQWTAIAKPLQGRQGYRVMGVSLDSIGPTRTFAQEQVLDYPVIVVPKDAFSKAYKILGTPQTLVVDHQGRIKGSWVGILDSLKRENILSTL